MNETSRTICYACEEVVLSRDLIPHWNDECVGVRAFTKLAETIAQPEPPLLELAWAQIEDILVEQGFAR